MRRIYSVRPDALALYVGHLESRRGCFVTAGDGEGRGVCSLGLKEWAHQDSNLGPSEYESDALTN